MLLYVVILRGICRFRLKGMYCVDMFPHQGDMGFLLQVDRGSHTAKDLGDDFLTALMLGFMRNRRTALRRLLRLLELLRDDLMEGKEMQSAVELFLSVVRLNIPEIGIQLEETD